MVWGRKELYAITFRWHHKCCIIEKATYVRVQKYIWNIHSAYK